MDDMALVIRTLYNNQNWIAPCKEPYKDSLCYFSIENKCKLDITPPKSGDMFCSGSCWERKLCKEYCWGCNPKGNFWGKRTVKGMKVFLIFRQLHKPDTLYTLWWKTLVDSVDNFIDKSGQKGKDGYALMHFKPFIAAPRNKWASNLTSSNVVGNLFGNGNYRFVKGNIATLLDSLI